MKALILTTKIRAAAFTPSSITEIKPLPREDLKQKWVHVCSVADHTRNGIPVEEEFLRLFVADFYSRQEPGPVYLGHADADLPPGTEEPPARAWVLALELRDKQLWALYALTDELETAISKGHYLYNSIYGGYELNEEGDVTKAEFISIAVTNQPAVPNLLPMAAKRGKNETKDLYKQALKDLPDDAEPSRFLDYVNARLELLRVIEGERTEMEGQTEGTAPAALAADEPGENKEQMIAKLLMDLSGLDAAAVVAAIESKPQEFAALIAGEPAAATADQQAATLLQSTIKTLSAKIDELEKARATELAATAKATAEARVNELVKAGRVLDAEKAGWIALATTQPAQFEMLSTSLKPAVPVGSVLAKPAISSHPITEAIEDSDPKIARLRNELRAAKVKDIDGAIARFSSRQS